MEIGMNIGYAQTKGYTKVDEATRRVLFASAVGTPDKAHFSLNGSEGIILTEPENILVGEEAVLQSRFLNRREDRGFTQSSEWYTLFLAALSEITTGTPEAWIVTGLPVAFYQGDKETVKARIEGAHTFRREGRQQQTITVKKAIVIPEPFGTLFDVLWDDQGKITAGEIATGSVGVIDVGGKTTNLLSVTRVKEIGRETASVNAGGWDMVRAVRTWLETHCPKLDLRDHEIAQAIVTRNIKYYGQPVDLSEIVNQTAEKLAEQVIAQATQLWNGAAGLDAVLITGGGALLLGEQIKADENFHHARIVPDPVMSNARGFWKYARHLKNRAE